VGRTQDFLMLNLVVYRFTTGPQRIKVVGWKRGIPFRRKVCSLNKRLVSTEQPQQTSVIISAS